MVFIDSGRRGLQGGPTVACVHARLRPAVGDDLLGGSGGRVKRGGTNLAMLACRCMEATWHMNML